MSRSGYSPAPARLWHAQASSHQSLRTRLPQHAGASPERAIPHPAKRLPARTPAVSAGRKTTDWLGSHLAKLVELREDPRRQRQLFDHSPVPMVMVDGERRGVYANLPARLVLRHRLASLRRLRIDDLTPPHGRSKMEAAWRELRSTGGAGGAFELASPPGATLTVLFSARANAQPGLNLIAFVPAEWDPGDLHADFGNASLASASLTARELEVLELAADGLTSQMIAERLVVSVTTVSTHFRNIYEKMGVRDRAAAVAAALRLGLIV